MLRMHTFMLDPTLPKETRPTVSIWPRNTTSRWSRPGPWRSRPRQAAQDGLASRRTARCPTRSTCSGWSIWATNTASAGGTCGPCRTTLRRQSRCVRARHPHPAGWKRWAFRRTKSGTCWPRTGSPMRSGGSRHRHRAGRPGRAFTVLAGRFGIPGDDHGAVRSSHLARMGADRGKANETNNKKMPVAVEVVDLLGDDASVAHCDPVTGLCVVPARTHRLPRRTPNRSRPRRKATARPPARRTATSRPPAGSTATRRLRAKSTPTAGRPRARTSLLGRVNPARPIPPAAR